MIKEKIKEIVKNRIFMFALTALVFSVVGVSAATYFPSNDVTYDNTQSGLTSTNVQEAIDELYKNCSVMTSFSNYLFFAVNSEDYSGATTGGTLYRTDLNGNNQTTIYSSRSNRVDNIYVTKDYLFFAVNREEYHGQTIGGTLYRTDLDGDNQIEIYSSRSNRVGSIYVVDDYLFFAVNSEEYNGQTIGGTLYRTNLNGDNQIEIYNSSNNRISI